MIKQIREHTNRGRMDWRVTEQLPGEWIAEIHPGAFGLLVRRRSDDASTDSGLTATIVYTDSQAAVVGEDMASDDAGLDRAVQRAEELENELRKKIRERAE